MNPKMTNKRHEVAAGSLTKSAIITLREKFLCDPLHTDLSTLRPVIARSWQRSALCQVSPAQKTMELVAKTYRYLDEEEQRAASASSDSTQTKGSKGGKK
mgnify:CR=1 FL=1